jgi:hypothetical protein
MCEILLELQQVRRCVQLGQILRGGCVLQVGLNNLWHVERNRAERGQHDQVDSCI